MNGLFVTGTDTGVGKTVIATALVRLLATAGRRVFGFKPIETGCTPGELGPDQQAMVDAAGDWQTGSQRGVYSFTLAAAPAVAARAESAAIDLARILAIAHSTPADAIVVEGAGGWRVPVGDATDISTLAGALGLPVVIVARAGLGTINHSLLTIDAVERDGCRVAGLVLSHRPDDDLAFTASNAGEIGARWPGQVVIYAGDPAVLRCFT